MIMEYKISELKKRFLQDQDIGERSREIYENNLKLFWRWLFISSKDINKLQRSDIIKYKSYLEKNYQSIYTIRNYFTAVKLFYRWAEQEGIYDNIAAGLRQLRYEKKINKMPLLPDQVNKLFSKIDQTTKKGKRDYAMIYMMIALGLRVGELSSINIDDIYKTGNNARIKIKGKGCKTKEQVMSIDETLMETINNYLATRKYKDQDPLFIVTRRSRETRVTVKCIQEVVKSYFNLIGLKTHEYSTHSLRHTTATTLLMHGRDIREVQAHMRHSKPETTEVYLRFINEQKRLSNTVSRDFARIFNIAKNTRQNQLNSEPIKNSLESIKIFSAELK